MAEFDEEAPCPQDGWAVDVSAVMSVKRRAGVALDALNRVQNAARAAGKTRMSWGQRKRRFISGGVEEEFVEDSESSAKVNPHLPAELQAYEAHMRDRGAAWVATPGLAASRTKFRRSDSLGAVLGSLIRDRGWDDSEKLGSIMVKWPEIAGEQVAAHCVIESIDDGRLVIRCDSTAWMNQMKLLLPHLERQIEMQVGSGVVKQTIIRGPQAPSWKHGKLSVPGRGPRDTYG